MARSRRTRVSPERYEPLPELHAIPGWLWRRAPRWIRAALVGALLLAVAATVALAPDVQESKRERARAQAAERRAAVADRVRALRAEQRPRTGRAAGAATPDATAAEQLAARRRQLTAVEARILADARARRLPGARPRRVSCRIFPRGVRKREPHEHLRRRRGRYACIAITADIPPTATNAAALLGHPYRMLIDFRSGRYAFCKISGVPGEGALRRRRLVTVPRACGGR